MLSGCALWDRSFGQRSWFSSNFDSSCPFALLHNREISSKSAARSAKVTRIHACFYTAVASRRNANEKISQLNCVTVPRQIAIVIYRYLRPRNSILYITPGSRRLAKSAIFERPRAIVKPWRSLFLPKRRENFPRRITSREEAESKMNHLITKATNKECPGDSLWSWNPDLQLPGCTFPFLTFNY